MKIIKKKEKQIQEVSVEKDGDVWVENKEVEVEVEYVAIPQPDILIRKDEYIANLQAEKEKAQAEIAERESKLTEVQLLANKK